MPKYRIPSGTGSRGTVVRIEDESMVPTADELAYVLQDLETIARLEQSGYVPDLQRIERLRVARSGS